MKRNLYTVYDKVMEEAGPLFYANNHSHAKRNFMQMIQDVKVDKVLDYELVHIAVINTNTMQVEVVSPETIIIED